MLWLFSSARFKHDSGSAWAGETQLVALPETYLRNRKSGVPAVTRPSMILKLEGKWPPVLRAALICEC